MCTLVTVLRPGSACPLLLAANRDEMLDRPWRPPAAHWPAQPDVVGGLDILAGGTWLALNRATGVVAAVLNRAGSLGPAAGKESRGLLPLQALRASGAAAAARAMQGQDAGRWRSFNLVVGDRSDVFWVTGRGAGELEVQRLSDGLHMITAADADDAAQPRIARHLPRFRDAPLPQPPCWGQWPALLADAEGEPRAALNIRPGPVRFGTASSALIGLAEGAIVFSFAAGAPDRTAFLPVALQP